MMRILVVDDDRTTSSGIQIFLEAEGFEIETASDGLEALNLLRQSAFDLIVSDVKMPQMNGLELLERLSEMESFIPVIIMTAYATVEEAVKALQKGADDYLTKPLNLDELIIKIRKVTKGQALIRENRQLRDRLKYFEFPEMVGESKVFQQVKESIRRLDPDSDVPVVVVGESGTGKELAARTIHARSIRNAKPFIAVNCAAFSEGLLESELFGHKKGAFTGAVKDKNGIFKVADSGTLFLDEVGEMSPAMQVKLLRVLQEGVIQPVGSTEILSVDVRIIGASNKKLDELVQEGAFREDLFYRINVVEITMPPLRAHAEDIPLLVEHFTQKYPGRQNPIKFSKEASAALNRYGWPGNIRELENFIRMMTAMTQSSTVELENLPERIVENLESSKEEAGWLHISNFKQAQQNALDHFERAYLKHHLSAFQNNISKTAAFLDISRVALHQKIKKYGLL